MGKKQTFTVYSIGSEHVIGDEKCQTEWCDGGYTYPKECICGGLIHAEFGDEMEDGYYILTKCDKCGDTFDQSKELMDILGVKSED